MNPLQTTKSTWRSRWRVRAAGLAAAAMLAACGGGGYGDGGGGLTCSIPDQKIWLRDYMNDWYYWYAISPNPDPSSYPDVDSYFNALLYTGTDANFPADRWSFLVSQECFDRTYGEGKTLGYGLMVAGLEVTGHPELPLYARYIEPGSPAAQGGLLRGDQILTINGKTSAEVITSGNYDDLSAFDTGETLVLGVRNSDGDRQVTLTSAIYNLVPVPNTAVITTTLGRPMGYVMVKDMIDQALTPFDAAFAQFKAAGVQEVVIDLRYNGGGLISVADKLASYPNGPTTAGNIFSSLIYNNKKQGYDENFRFQSYANATGLARVYVLTGPRTCSASEQVINALRPFVNVVTIGDTSCGKPVGFLPQADGCGTVINAVNFEAVNSMNEGRYFDGFDASCPVAEDLSQPIGSSGDPLLVAAQDHADGFGCPTLAASAKTKLLGLRKPVERPRWREPFDRQGMIGK